MRKLLCLALLFACACEREDRDFAAQSTPPQFAAPANDLIAGEPPLTEGAQLDPNMPGYKETAYDISQGRTLYNAFNCVGCHANGGGAIGPAFMDKTWFYGSTPYQVASSILSGRPRGMPSFRGKLVRGQLYQLTAFVRSLGGLVRGDAIGARPDDLMLAPVGDLDEHGLPTMPKETP